MILHKISGQFIATEQINEIWFTHTVSKVSKIFKRFNLAEVIMVNPKSFCSSIHLIVSLKGLKKSLTELKEPIRINIEKSFYWICLERTVYCIVRHGMHFVLYLSNRLDSEANLSETIINLLWFSSRIKDQEHPSHNI